MNRYLVIFVIALFLIIGVAVGVVLYVRSNQQSPVGQGVTTTTTLPVVPEPGGSSSSSDAKAAFQNQIPQGMEVTLGTNVVAGSYSLQLWTDAHGGGEALLKYDATQSKWTVVSWGGGAWAVDSLVAEGVPQTTATALLTGMPH